MKILIGLLLAVTLTGCALLPYEYNENLSPEENAYYHQRHIENGQRVFENVERSSQAMIDWSERLQRNDRLRIQGSGNSSRCREVGQFWQCD